jgi:hypothetical protein
MISNFQHVSIHQDMTYQHMWTDGIGLEII